MQEVGGRTEKMAGLYLKKNPKEFITFFLNYVTDLKIIYLKTHGKKDVIKCVHI